ncbi:DUF2271 domain-containing protein [Urechidicola vernalis]|uniref:DUF2271 domain-containing protein n=1 Tax=Urechidicola vernalis TaxID=3075600 RepID=A0ABU2Y686_9FLAO|nr:DUF2271 domain-containing protein [Urechidicola sp. P050]MDT0553202.1 DUF2271 domain-containing protein [Urechidicola sp. P050]
MKQISKLAITVLIGVFTLMSFSKMNDKTSVKCMVQMINYEGEGAYIIISLLDPDGNYKETLYVQGDDKEWYNDITEWWAFHGKQRPNIDAITGETIAGGERSMNVINIPTDAIDNGHKLRFETSVEEQEYHVADLEFELTTENLSSKKEGTGFIRYVRLMPQK